MVAALLHAGVFWQVRDPAGGERLLPPAPFVSVRVLNLEPAVVAAAVSPPQPGALPFAAGAPVAFELPPERPPAPTTAPLPPPSLPTDSRQTGAGSPASGEAQADGPPVAFQRPAPEASAAEARTPPTVGLPAAPDYALSARLDPGPTPLEWVEPDYPATALRRPGAVTLRLLIGETGELDDVSIVRATPPGVFDSAALTALRKSRWAPGRLLGRPVKSQLTIEVEFAETNRGATVSGRSY